MRLTDLFLALPALIFAAAIAASFDGGMIPTSVALAAVFWPPYARRVRARVLSLRQLDDVAADRAMGAAHLRLIFETLLPMVWPLVIGRATTDVGFRDPVGLWPVVSGAGGAVADAGMGGDDL